MRVQAVGLCPMVWHAVVVRIRRRLRRTLSQIGPGPSGAEARAAGPLAHTLHDALVLGITGWFARTHAGQHRSRKGSAVHPRRRSALMVWCCCSVRQSQRWSNGGPSPVACPHAWSFFWMTSECILSTAGSYLNNAAAASGLQAWTVVGARRSCSPSRVTRCAPYCAATVT